MKRMLAGTASAPAQTFLEQLQELPSIPETTGVTVWGWFGPPGPKADDPEQLAWSRVAGGVLSWALSEEYVRQGAQLAEKSGAKFGLRLHPFFGYKHPPGYRGPEFHKALERVHRTLQRARIAAGSTPIDVVLVDVETWIADSLKAKDRAAWNRAMTHNHQLVRSLIYVVIGPSVHVEWYGASPRWSNLTLNESIETASMILYYPLRPEIQKEIIKETIAFQYARGLRWTTAYVSPGSGYEYDLNKHIWSWRLETPLQSSAWLAERLRGARQVHFIVDYAAFHREAKTTWPAHTIAFLKALAGE